MTLLTIIVSLLRVLCIGIPHAVVGRTTGGISTEEELRIKEFLKRSVTVGTEKVMHQV